jgi:hypothetical protein
MIRRVIGAVCLTLLAACAQKPDAAKKPMTTAQRDSAIAESKLPGAGVVKKAIEVSDSAESRANQPVPEPR